MTSLRDQFVALVLEGSPGRETLEKALREVLTKRDKRKGAVEKAKEKATNLLIKSIDKIMEFLPVQAMRVSPVGTGVQDIPSPACMDEHLPKDRKWTKADIEKAWDTCLNNTSK